MNQSIGRARAGRDAGRRRTTYAAASDDRLLIFANGYAGMLSRLNGPLPLAQYAREAGLNPEFVFTRSPAHLRRLLRERVIGQHHRVAVAGGDGTIHAAVQELAHSGVALGILPLGTANNFATALRLPADLPSAVRVLAEGEERTVDLGDAGGDYFTEAAGVGLFADTLAATGAKHGLAQWMKGLGHLWNVVSSNRAERVTVVVDGQPYTEDALSVTVANSYYLGYNVPIAPCARLTDARLDVVIIGALTRSELPLYYRAIRAQAHLGLPKVSTFRAREVELRGRRPLTVHVDERTRRRTPVALRVAPQALKVIVDRL